MPWETALGAAGPEEVAVMEDREDFLEPQWIAWLALAAIAAAAVLRLYHLGELSLWGDEIRSVLIADQSWPDFFGTIWRGEVNMTLFFALLNIWLDIVSSRSEAALRLLPALLSVGAVPMAFLLARDLYGKGAGGALVGLIVALLMALNAWQIEFAQELRSYSLAILLTMTASILFVRGMERPRTWTWIGYGVVVALGVYAHLFAALLPVAHGVSLLFLLVAWRGRLPWFKLILAALVVAGLVIPLALLAYFTTTAEDKIGWVDPTSWETVRDFLVAVGGGRALVAGFAGALAAMGLGLGIARAVSRKDALVAWRYLVAACCFGVPPVAALVYSEISTPTFFPKFLIFVQPYLLFLAAAGIVGLLEALQRLWRHSSFRLAWWGGGAVIVALLTTGFAQATARYYRNASNEQVREVAQFLEQEMQDGDVMFCFIPRVCTFVTFYSPERVAPPISNARMTRLLTNAGSAEEVAASLPQDADSVYLVIGRSNTATRLPQLALFREAIGMINPVVTAYPFRGFTVERYASVGSLADPWLPLPSVPDNANFIVGDEGDNELTGTARADVILGMGGNDTITGGSGDDIICGGAGDDVIVGNAGSDRLDGGPGNDRMNGGFGADVLWGREGDDQLHGGAGVGDEGDLLMGGPGQDQLVSRDERDLLIRGSYSSPELDLSLCEQLVP